MIKRLDRSKMISTNLAGEFSTAMSKSREAISPEICINDGLSWGAGSFTGIEKQVMENRKVYWLYHPKKSFLEMVKRRFALPCRKRRQRTETLQAEPWPLETISTLEFSGSLSHSWLDTNSMQKISKERWSTLIHKSKDSSKLIKQL